MKSSGNKSNSLNCQGIGKIIYRNMEKEWNFPHFHFVVFKGNTGTDNTYCAFCMELGVEGYGPNDRGAIKDLLQSCNGMIDHLLAKGRDSLFQHLNMLARGSHSEVFWESYRIVEIELASRAADLGNAVLEHIPQEIRDEIRDEINRQVLEEKLQNSPYIKDLEISQISEPLTKAA